MFTIASGCDTKANCQILIDEEKKAIALFAYSDIKNNIDLLEYALQIPFVLNTAAPDQWKTPPCGLRRGARG